MKVGHVIEYNMKNNCLRPESAPLVDDSIEYMEKIHIIGNIDTK